jgi:hypothetical protein
MDRPMRDGRATAYVCRDFACREPTTDPETLKTLLASETHREGYSFIRE